MGDDDFAQPVVREEVHAQALALFGPLSLHMGGDVLLLALVGHAPVLPVCVGLLDVLHLAERQLEPRLGLVGVDDAAARISEDERMENHGDRPQHRPDLARAPLGEVGRAATRLVQEHEPVGERTLGEQERLDGRRGDVHALDDGRPRPQRVRVGLRLGGGGLRLLQMVLERRQVGREGRGSRLGGSGMG